MLTALKISLSGFIFTRKMCAPGMTVMKNGKPAALTWLLPLSGWFSESNVVLGISESEDTYLKS